MNIKPFSTQEQEKIKAEYLHKPLRALARELNTNRGRLGRYLKRNGLEVPKSVAANRQSASRFKTGHVPKGKGKGASATRYKYVKNDRGQWITSQRAAWENVNGPLSPGEIVRAKDGDPSNLRLDNLEVITRAESMYRNSVHDNPEEVIPSLVLINEISKKIKHL